MKQPTLPKYWLLTILLLAAGNLLAQDAPRKLSYSELVQEMIESKGFSYELSDAIVSYDPEKDEAYSHSNLNLQLNKAPIVIKKNIVLKRVTFDREAASDIHHFLLIHVEFKKMVTFEQVSGGDIFFEQCTFRKKVRLTNCTFNLVRFGKSKVRSGFEVIDSKISFLVNTQLEVKDNCLIKRSTLTSVDLLGSEYDGDVTVTESNIENFISRSCKFYSNNRIAGPSLQNIFFSNCKFKPKYSSFLYLNPMPLGISSRERIKRVSIERCRFDTLSSKDYIALTGNDIGYLELSQDTIYSTLHLSGSRVDKRFVVMDNEFHNYLNWGPFSFPTNNSDCLWDQVSGHLCIKGRDTSSDARVFIPYTGGTPEELDDFPLYAKLKGTYSRFYRLYQYDSDGESANGAYIEMKDLETRWLKHRYEQDSKLSHYFDWKINVFLKTFSNYGTDPVKSIIYSLYVILIFGAFYFFFPNEWDEANNRRLTGHLRKMVDYFRSQQSLSDLYSRERAHEIQSYEEFRAMLDQHEKEVPPLIRAISLPLYRLSVSDYWITRNLLSWADPTKGKWSELPSSQKVKIGILVGAYLFIYAVFVLILKLLAAFTLSLNAFTTLGFGNIPTKGLARYVVILQGFIGWFMLTIFSVSLINQVLQ
ncbi:MAG: hypothetical protein AAGI38_07355 [Bacteroidota bacterium]